MNHTPTPWTLGKSCDGFLTVTNGSATICTVGEADIFDDIEADAAYIVRAVNSHAALTAALALLVHGTMGYPALLEQYHSTDTCELPENCQHCYCVKQARAALALAEGKEPQA